ncbi:DUF6802 family protein, partial [Corynebacterium heidelbergense]
LGAGTDFGGDFGGAGGFGEGVPDLLDKIAGLAGERLELADGTSGGLLFTVGGVEYQISDSADGQTATFADDRGMTILSDLDGDGRVDYVSDVTFEGQWSAWRWSEGPEGGPHDTPRDESARGSRSGSWGSPDAWTSRVSTHDEPPASPELRSGQEAQGQQWEAPGGFHRDPAGDELGNPEGAGGSGSGQQSWQGDLWECVESGRWG